MAIHLYRDPAGEEVLHEAILKSLEFIQIFFFYTYTCILRVND